MTPEEGLQRAFAELEAGIALTKCRKCGCMESALKNLAAILLTIGTNDASAPAESVNLKGTSKNWDVGLGARRATILTRRTGPFAVLSANKS